jgi:hypothetical protein
VVFSKAAVPAGLRKAVLRRKMAVKAKIRDG